MLAAELQRHDALVASGTMLAAALKRHDELVASGAAPAPSHPTATIPTGHYHFGWRGGTIAVELRAGGVFWCRKFPAAASYAVEGDTVKIDWGRFGKYELNAKSGDAGAGVTAVLMGSVAGSDATDDWRTATFVRPFTPQEELLSGSAWELHHEGGTPFRVEFHASGDFHCKAYPGLRHTWTLDGDRVAVDWGVYGQYELTIDAAARQMRGHLRGNAASWRRLEFVASLPPYVEPQTCEKGCCMRALGDALPCTYIARKRGMMREEDEREMHRVNPCTPSGRANKFR